MAILDDILNKNKNKGANSFLPVDDQNLEKQADNSPIVGDGAKTVTAQENMQAEQSAALPEVKYPNKPQGLNDGEYEHLLKYYSPEAITKFSAPFDPSSGENILQRYYESTMPKPSAPDEKKLRNRRIIAGIADGASMLSQMISAGSGAHMRERNDFALPKIQQQEKEEQNRYLQLSQRYNDGLFQARLKDFQKALDDYNNGRKGIQGVLAAKQKLDQAQSQFENKQQFAYDKLAQDQANKDKDYELKKQNTESQIAQRKALVAQGWARVADSKNRTTAYIKRVSSGGGKNELQLMIPANPNDPNTTKNELGENVKVLTLTKDEASSYARAAKTDPSFFDRHPHLVLSRPDKYTGSGKTTYAKDDEIAAAYAKDVYDSGFNIVTSSGSTGGSPLYNYWQNNQGPISQEVIDAYSNGTLSDEEVESQEDEFEEFAIGNF